MSTPAALTVSLAEAARLLGMSESYARELERAGTFPVRVRRVGSWLRVSRADIDAYLGVSTPTPPAVDAASILLAAEIVATQTKLEFLVAQTIARPPVAAGAPAPAPEKAEEGVAA
jgi:predicted DNA-binding transcriptional regulator AlpA